MCCTLPGQDSPGRLPFPRDGVCVYDIQASSWAWIYLRSLNLTWVERSRAYGTNPKFPQNLQHTRQNPLLVHMVHTLNACVASVRPSVCLIPLGEKIFGVTKNHLNKNMTMIAPLWLRQLEVSAAASRPSAQEGRWEGEILSMSVKENPALWKSNCQYRRMSTWYITEVHM